MQISVNIIRLRNIRFCLLFNISYHATQKIVTFKNNILMRNNYHKQRKPCIFSPFIIFIKIEDNSNPIKYAKTRNKNTNLITQNPFFDYQLNKQCRADIFNLNTTTITNFYSFFFFLLGGFKQEH